MDLKELAIFHKLTTEKNLKYISYDEACIFLSKPEDRIMLENPDRVAATDQKLIEDPPPSYSIHDPLKSYHPNAEGEMSKELSSQIFRANRTTKIEGDACRNKQEIGSSPPLFANEIPHELRQVKRNVAQEICTILQLAYLRNCSRRRKALADRREELEVQDRRATVNGVLPSTEKDCLLTPNTIHVEAEGKTSTYGRSLFKRFRYRVARQKASSNIGAESSSEHTSCAAGFDDVTRKSCTLPCSDQYCLDNTAEYSVKDTKNMELWPPKCCKMEAPAFAYKQVLTTTPFQKLQATQTPNCSAGENRCSYTRSRYVSSSLPTPASQRAISPYCRSTRHLSGEYSPADTSVEALRKKEPKDWRDCPVCSPPVVLLGDNPYVKCLCEYGFCWICNEVAFDCPNDHSGFGENTQKVRITSAVRQRKLEADLDKRLALDRVLSKCPLNIDLNRNSTQHKKLVEEILTCPTINNLQNRFQVLRETLRDVQEMQLDRIRRRNQVSIDLAIELCNSATKEYRVLNDKLEPNIPRLINLRQAFALESMKLSNVTETRSLKDAIRVLHQAVTCLHNDEKWAELTFAQCLKMLQTVEEWEWEAMLRARYPLMLRKK